MKAHTNLTFTNRTKETDRRDALSSTPSPERWLVSAGGGGGGQIIFEAGQWRGLLKANKEIAPVCFIYTQAVKIRLVQHSRGNNATRPNPHRTIYTYH